MSNYRFVKLWAVSGENIAKVKAGQTVTVSKADGTPTEVIIGSVADVNGQRMAFAAPKARPKTAASKARPDVTALLGQLSKAQIKKLLAAK